MTLDALIMLSGAFVATLPFLGFPNKWDTALFFLAGMFIVALGIIVRRRGTLHQEKTPAEKNNSRVFVESAPRPMSEEPQSDVSGHEAV